MMESSSTINVHNQDDYDTVKMIIDINYSQKRKRQLLEDNRSYCAMVVAISELVLKSIGGRDIKLWIPKHKNNTQDVRLEVSLPNNISAEKVKNEIKNASGYAIEDISIFTK
jgi:hypothetical protein